MYNFAPHELAAIEQMKQMAPQQQQEYLNSKMGQMPIWQLMAWQNEVKRQEKMHAALPQQKAPQTTVAQDLQQKLGQGLASQPVQNVGSPQAYATGGIVAFNDGGDVQHFQNTGLVDPTSTQQYMEDNPTIFDEPVSGVKKWWAEKTASDNEWRKQKILQGIRNKDRGYMSMVTRNPESMSKIGITQAEIDDALKYTAPTKGAAPAKQAETKGEQTAAPDYEGLAALVGKQRPDDGAGGGFRVSMPSFGNAPNLKNFDDGYITGMEKERTAEEAKIKDPSAYIRQQMSEREALEKEQGMGQALEKQGERVAKMEKNIPSSEKGFWMALAKSGFALAGARNWAEGIRAGGQEGIAAYEKFQDHRRDLEEKYANAKFQLETAQEAVKAGRLTAAEADLKEQKGIVRSLGDKISAAKHADNLFVATQAGENFRAELTARTTLAAHAMSASASAKDRAVLERMIKLTSVMNDKRNPAGVRAAAQEELQNYTSAIGAKDLAEAQGDIARVKAAVPSLDGIMPGGNVPQLKLVGVR